MSSGATLKLIFLGTGGSWPSKTRNVPSLAVKYDSEVILFDCGEGTQRQFMFSKVSFMQIKRIFISHYHGDHFLGLPGLVQSMYLNERTEPLEIYGPGGTEEIMGVVLKLGYFSPSFDINVHDIEDGQIFNFEKYDISVRSANHNVPSFAYAFEEHPRPGQFNKQLALDLGIPEGPMFGKLQRGETVNVNGSDIEPESVLGPARPGRKIVYTGDTQPSSAVEELARNCDVLIHESTFDVELEQKANKYGHSSARQAAEIAKAAGARQLFLMHISPRYDDGKILESQAKEVFPNAKVASDLDEVEIKFARE